jgi:hypothetical protein
MYISSSAVEGVHAEGHCDIVLEKHIDGLVVHNVVIAFENAFSV